LLYALRCRASCASSSLEPPSFKQTPSFPTPPFSLRTRTLFFRDALPLLLHATWFFTSKEPVGNNGKEKVILPLKARMSILIRRRYFSRGSRFPVENVFFTLLTRARGGQRRRRGVGGVAARAWESRGKYVFIQCAGARQYEGILARTATLLILHHYTLFSPCCSFHAFHRCIL